MSIKALRRIQIGKEGTAGTTVSASTIMRTEGTLEDLREVIFIPEDIGYISGIDRVEVAKLEGHLTMDETPASFEQLLEIFAASINVDTGTADGAGAGVIHNFVFPTTAQNTISTFSIEGGDDGGAEGFDYGFVENFTLSGEAGDLVKITSEWGGHSPAPLTFTDTAVLPEVEAIPFSMGKLYIDDDTATIGTTQITSTWVSFNMDVKTGWQAVWTGDGSLEFKLIKQTSPEIVLELVMEHNASAIAEIAKWRSKSGRLIRMKWEGSSFTAGTSYSKKTLIVDLAGRWEKFDPLDEKDGNDIITATFRSRYNVAGSQFATIKVVNKLPTLS